VRQTGRRVAVEQVPDEVQAGIDDEVMQQLAMQQLAGVGVVDLDGQVDV